MNVLYAFLPLTLLFVEGHGGHSYTVVHHGSHSGVSTSYSYQSGGYSSHHASSINSGGSPSSSQVHTSYLMRGILNHNQHPPPYDGMPQSMGSAPHDGRPQSMGSAPHVSSSAGSSVISHAPTSRDVVQMLASKSIVDVMVDTLPFGDDSAARKKAKEEITKCIANSDHAAQMMHDKDVFAETFDWYMTMCKCHYNADSCPTRGWDVVPTTLLDLNLDDIKDLSMDAINSDENTFELQKWVVTRAFEVACIDTISEREINSFNTYLDSLVQFPHDRSHELQREEVQYFFGLLKIQTMEIALRSRQHACFDESAKESIKDKVKDAASHFNVPCITFSAMVTVEAGPTAPPEKRGNLRPAPFNGGQLGRAPGT